MRIKRFNESASNEEDTIKSIKDILLDFTDSGYNVYVTFDKYNNTETLYNIDIRGMGDLLAIDVYDMLLDINTKIVGTLGLIYNTTNSNIRNIQKKLKIDIHIGYKTSDTNMVSRVEIIDTLVSLGFREDGELPSEVLYSRGIAGNLFTVLVGGDYAYIDFFIEFYFNDVYEALSKYLISNGYAKLGIERNSRYETGPVQELDPVLKKISFNDLISVIKEILAYEN